MNKQALERARAHGREARRAADFLKTATDIEEATRAWKTLLIEGHRVFSKLSAGANGYGRTVPWIGGLKRDRKKDELLRYMHQARNADEHGIAEVVIDAPPTFSIFPIDPTIPAYISYMRHDGNSIAYCEGAKNAGIVQTCRRLELIAVVNGGVTYQPPRSHQGEPWVELAPARVAAAFMVYIDASLFVAAVYAEQAPHRNSAHTG